MNLDIESGASVCWYTPSAIGGHARYTKELLSEICRLGSQGDVFGLLTSENIESDFLNVDYEIHAILPMLAAKDKFSSKFTWVASRIFHYPIRELRAAIWLTLGIGRYYKIVHLQEWSPFFGAPMVFWLRLFGKKIVITVHNVEPHTPFNFVVRWIVEVSEKFIRRISDVKFVHTTALAERLAEKLGSQEGIVIAPHGLWKLEGFENSHPSHLKCLNNLLFFGAIRQNKGLPILLDSMKSLNQFRLRVAGAPEGAVQARKIQEMVNGLTPGSVDLRLGFIDEDRVDEQFSDIDIVVLPYVSFEAQSGVLWLALAHGIPVVVSDVGALGETVRELGVGVVVEANAPEKLADGIRYLSIESNYLAALKNIESVQSTKGWKEAAYIHYTAYRGLLNA